MDYEMTVGLEIHCELKTESKLFCGCRNAFGGKPNEYSCEGCGAFPGTLPAMNKLAVEYIVRAGLALNCKINKLSRWDRKSYFYPDLPKAWQVSQQEFPVCGAGLVEYEVGGIKKSARINRIHLEEDAGKLVHEDGVTKSDANRGGLSLIEIVTEPDFHSADEVVAFLDELKSILKYTGVSDVKMQEGSLRCDVNMSVAPYGSKTLGVRTETKNLNSFAAARRSIEWEYARQAAAVKSGEKLVQQTRRWDDAKGEGYAMRSKENAHDYRYFPDPDVLPLVLTDEDIAEFKSRLPELRKSKLARYTGELGLPEYDAKILTGDRDVSILFDGAVKLYNNPKKVSNYIMSEVLRKGKIEGSEDIEIRVSPKQLAGILELVEQGALSLAASRAVLDKIWGTSEEPKKATESLGLVQVNDAGEIEAVVKGIIDANPRAAAEYRAGNAKTAAFFVGQAMKATQGKCNPKMVGDILERLLK